MKNNENKQEMMNKKTASKIILRQLLCFFNKITLHTKNRYPVAAQRLSISPQNQTIADPLNNDCITIVLFERATQIFNTTKTI